MSAQAAERKGRVGAAVESREPVRYRALADWAVEVWREHLQREATKATGGKFD